MVVINRQIYQYFGFNPTGDCGPYTFYTKTNWNKVYFLKAPPTKPPTDWQVHQQFLFSYYALKWSQLTPAERTDWNEAAKLALLRISGYNLFFWYCFTLDLPTLATIERITGITLVKPFHN